MPEAHGPWTILSSEPKYRDEFVDVILDQALQPDGQPGHYVTVRVMPGVGVLPVDGEGCVYLVRQFRYALGAESLEAVLLTPFMLIGWLPRIQNELNHQAREEG